MNKQQVLRRRREEKMLSTLIKLNYATREQLQIIEDLGGDRNANRILKQMESDGLINSIRREQKVYYVTGKGKEVIGENKQQLKRDQIDHMLMRNDLYIRLNMPDTWKTEQQYGVGEDTFIKPDATYYNQGKIVFVEVDNTQTMRTNMEKLKKYSEVCKSIQISKGYKPTVLFYTLTETRKHKLLNEGVKNQIRCSVLLPVLK